jgi:GTP:adenosylcobinamide-phosphate guanylyltransferase
MALTQIIPRRSLWQERFRMKCILLAGNRKDYKPVGNQPNKALLEVGGSSIIWRMLGELNQVTNISEIAIVGPQKFLKPKIEPLITAHNFKKPVIFVEQGESLVENVYLGIEGFGLERNTLTPVFIMPGDLPLVQHQEIQDFLDRVDLNACDFATGLAPEEALKKYYPTETQSGIKMSYFYFAEGAFRANNFHVVRPGAVGFAEYVTKTYHLRYQKRFSNIILMLFELLKLMVKIPTGFLFYLGMQWIRLLNALRLKKLGSFFGNMCKIKGAEYYISIILDTRYRLIPMQLGGAALDVDNDADYATICARFNEWTEDRES